MEGKGAKVEVINTYWMATIFQKDSTAKKDLTAIFYLKAVTIWWSVNIITFYKRL